MLLRLLYGLGLTAAAFGLLKTESPNDGNSFKVFRIFPNSPEDLSAIKLLYERSTELELDFWKTPTDVGAFVDIMSPPSVIPTLRDFLDENHLDFKITIEDVERLIQLREKSPSIFSRPNETQLAANPILAAFFRKRMSDDYSSTNKAKYRFGEYHTYEEMVRWMRELERFYPQICQTFVIGNTHEGRQMVGLKIGNPVGDTNKRAVWVDAGIHAREWASIHTALFFIEQLITGYGVDTKITNYINTLNFYFLPVANPDGFTFSQSDITPQTRFWRKNRGNQVCKKDPWRRDRCCAGVDLNRNFDFHWGETGSSTDICSDIYAGSGAFSEPETRAIRDKIMSAELNGKLDAFITLHTYSQMWIHPYNHERRSFPHDVRDLENVGKRGVEAIEKVYGTKFRFGTGADILYPSAGGSDDWAKSKAGVKYVYLLELRPGEEEWDGFLLDRRQLIPTGRETWEGVKVVIDAVVAKAGADRHSTPSPTLFSTEMSSIHWVSAQALARPSATTPPPATTNFPLTRPTLIGRRINAENLRNSLHDRLSRLRLTQKEARRRFEERIRQQETQITTTPISIAEGQSFLQFGPTSALIGRTASNVSLHQPKQQGSSCSDRSRWCAAWIQQNARLCEISAIYMRADCAKSCRFC